jgi:hypothetical protein
VLKAFFNIIITRMILSDGYKQATYNFIICTLENMIWKKRVKCAQLGSSRHPLVIIFIPDSEIS